MLVKLDDGEAYHICQPENSQLKKIPVYHCFTESFSLVHITQISQDTVRPPYLFLTTEYRLNDRLMPNKL